MNRPEALSIIALIQAYFPRPELPESTVLAWGSELESLDLTLDEARQAVIRMAWREKYPSLRGLDEARKELLDERPAPRALVGTPWTEEDRSRSMRIGSRVLREWRQRGGVGAADRDRPRAAEAANTDGGAE